MARPQRHVPRDSSRRRIWVYVAVAAFLLVDILLVAWALTGARADAKVSAHRPIPTYSATPRTDVPTATPEPTPEITPIVSVPPARILAALDETTAWRALTGECPEATASPELTTDSGETWKSTDATKSTEVTALQRIRVNGPRVASMLGFSQDGCEPQFVKTYVAGDSFKSYPEEVDSSWYVNPADRATVHSPTGDVAAPCDSVIALAPRDADAAAVLCADQTIHATTDGAATWAKSVAVPGAVNLTVTQTGYIYTAVGLPECAGVQLIALSAKPLKITPTGCLPVETPAETMPGNVAVSEAAGTVWLWAGDVFKRSQDEGATWQ